jgi:histone-lysine N-methyltransferase SETMAR
LKEKWLHLAKKKVLFHQANTPAHRSLVVKLVELGSKLLPHPRYSPDLAPCDFFLFPNMKKWLCEKRLASNEEVITETEANLAEFNYFHPIF